MGALYKKAHAQLCEHRRVRRVGFVEVVLFMIGV